MQIRKFEIYSEGNLLKGRHYKALTEKQQGKTILMCHGFAGIQDLFFPRYAEKFAQAGFDVVTFDYHGFGESEGETEIIPSKQMQDILNVILFVERDEELKNNKLILWGSSLGGNYALALTAMKKTISAVYAQITFSVGLRNNTVGLSEEDIEKYVTQLDNIKYKEIMENKKLLLPLKKLLSDEQSKNFLENYKEIFPDLLKIKLPLTTIRYINDLALDNILSNISVPVLLGKAKKDCVNSSEEMDKIYGKLSCPKKLLEFDCGHYEIYESDIFEQGIKEQISWFSNIG